RRSFATGADMRNSFWSRRHVIRAAAAAGALGWLWPQGTFARQAGPTRTALLSLIRHRESAAVIGRHALDVLPRLRNRMRLLSEISSDLKMNLSDIARADRETMRARLTARIEQDFAAGQTVKLDGWLFSLAEARLCALAAQA